MRAGPSGEERCTPHYTVPISPQCPQEISRLTLPVFQGAAVSSERFSQSLPPRNVAELGGSPPLRGSLEQLGRPSPAGRQCPQEISLLTLPVFQGAAVSSERFSQSLPPRNVAELGGSPPLRGSLEQLDRPSPAGPLFQGTELAALSTPEASLKRLVPLVGHPAAWEPLPSVSHWDLPEQTLVPSLA